MKNVVEIPKKMVENNRSQKPGVSLISQNEDKVKPHLLAIYKSMKPSFSSRNAARVELVVRHQEKVFEFGRKLLCLIHLVYGNPARSTELVSLRWFNGQDQRNVFVEGDLLCLAIRYKKTIRITRNSKAVYRFLPACVSNLIYHYILMLNTLQVALITLTPGYAPSPYLIGSIKDNGVLLLFRSVFEEKSGIVLKFSEFRQLMALMMRQTVIESEGWVELNKLIAKQAGRSGIIDAQHYGISSLTCSNTTVIEKYHAKCLSQLWHLKLKLVTLKR
jgi:hypothetical protein